MKFDLDLLGKLRSKHYDRVIVRLRQYMAEREVDALVLFREDHFAYVNTEPSVFLRSGLIGSNVIVIPASGEVFGICQDFEEAALRSGLVPEWFPIRTFTGIEDRFAKLKKQYATDDLAQFGEQARLVLEVLRSKLSKLGLANANIGLEISELRTSLFEGIRQFFPSATLVDSAEMFSKSMAEKTAYEIYCLRYAAFEQWRVAHKVMMDITPGTHFREIQKRIVSEVALIDEVDDIRFLAIYMPRNVGPTLRYFDDYARVRDLVSIDLALRVRGYAADSGRAYVLGEPDAMQRKIAETYTSAHEGAKSMFRPGTRLGDIFAYVEDKVRLAGVSDFRRGHIGHGLGCNQYMEEWPWIRRGTSVELKPNMVMTLEIPFYGRDFGAFFVEEILLITESGCEPLTTAPIGLNVIPIASGEV